MAYLNLKRLSAVVCVLALVAVALVFALPRTEAQVAEAPVLKPKLLAESTAVERSWEEMALAPEGPAVTPRAAVPFRPTMDESSYMAAKAQAAAKSPAGRPEMAAPALPPTTVVKNYGGVNQTGAGGWRPPDSEGYVGGSEYVQIVNSYIKVYKKSDNAVVRSQTLAQFFGYATQSLFDPRVIYDKVWKRWIVTAVAFPESANVMYFFMAVSKGPLANGNFWIYSVNTVINSGDFFDFPMSGFDQDAVFVTANNFNPGFTDARLYFVAKAKAYNGLGLNWYYYSGLYGTLTAPVCLDQNVYTWFVSAQPNTTPANSVISFYRFANLSRDGYASGVGPYNVTPAGGFALPPNAPQTGGEPLDTIDARFQNVSTQVTIGSRNALFNVHCINFGGAANRFYEFDVSLPAAPAIRQQGTFYTSGSSSDFNPHIAANESGDCFTVWSATDSANSKNAMVYFGGRRAAADLSTMGVNATPLFTSLAYYDDGLGNSYNRWGDYSAVSIDPANALKAWMTNETITGTSSPSTIWGTRIGAVKY
jgi:hypothetical protein